MAAGTDSRNLAAYTETLAGRVTTLATSVQALQKIEGRFSAYLYGTTPSADADKVSEAPKKAAPSLESIRQEFDEQLKALEEVIKNLYAHVEPTTNEVPGVAVGIGSP